MHQTKSFVESAEETSLCLSLLSLFLSLHNAKLMRIWFHTPANQLNIGLTLWLSWALDYDLEPKSLKNS